jgi:hypothetical protein
MKGVPWGKFNYSPGGNSTTLMTVELVSLELVSLELVSLEVGFTRLEKKFWNQIIPIRRKK